MAFEADLNQSNKQLEHVTMVQEEHLNLVALEQYDS